MATIKEITSTDWQLSLRGAGEIEQKSADVNQCLLLIFSTQKGSDPLRPEFGVDLLKWIDRPANVAAPGVINEMIAGLAYEERVSVEAITAKIEDRAIIFEVSWGYAEGFNPSYEAVDNKKSPNITCLLYTSPSPRD